MKHLAFGMDYAKSCCDLYTSLPGPKPLKHAQSSFLPEGSLITDGDEVLGKLLSNACRVLMETLWLSRPARPATVRPITSLAMEGDEVVQNL